MMDFRHSASRPTRAPRVIAAEGRPFTTFLGARGEVVDGRHKAGHDTGGWHKARHVAGGWHKARHDTGSARP